MDELFWRALSLSYRLSTSGVAIGLTSGAFITDIYFKHPSKYEHMNPSLSRRLINFSLGGCISGTVFTGILMNFLSRKCLHSSLIIICVIGWFIVLGTQNHVGMIFAQILIGYSHGGLSVIAPIYSAEMVPIKYRGIQVLSFRLMRAVGLLLGMVLTVVTAMNDMKTPYLNSALLLSVMLLPTFFLPESPLFLIQQNKALDASKILETLHGPYLGVEHELDDLKAQVDGVEPNKIYFITSLNRRGTKVALYATFYLSFVQQATELPIIFFWSTVPTETYRGPQRVYLNTVVFFFFMAQIVGIISSALVIDIIGRRVLLMVSTILTQISMFSLILRLQFFQSEFLADQSILDMVFLLVITVSHALGLNTIPVLLTTELYPADIKWFGITVTTLFTWIRHLMFHEVFSHLERQRVLTVNILFATILITFGVYVIVGCIPETSNRKLHEIHEILHNDQIVVG